MHSDSDDNHVLEKYNKAWAWGPFSVITASWAYCLGVLTVSELNGIFLILQFLQPDPEMRLVLSARCESYKLTQAL